MSNDQKSLSLDIVQIQKIQENRFPILFIDRVVEVVPGVRAHAIKNFSFNEWFFPVHFPDEPNVPGFIQVECLVQTFIMTFLTIDGYAGMKTNFASMNTVRFARKIVPGDKLDIFADLSSFKRGVARGTAEAFVDDERCCSAEFVVTVPEVFEKFRPRHTTG